MTKNQFENTIKLFDRIKEMSFFQRLFSWKQIIALSMEAYSEFKNLDNNFESMNTNFEESKQKVKELEQDIEHDKENILDLKSSIKELENKNTQQNSDNTELEKELAAYKKLEKKKQEEYEHKITEINSLKEQMDKDRIKITEERENEINQKFEDMKETWKNHEDLTEQSIKQICNKYTVEYVDKEKVPFVGKPDNTIKVADEFIIFDSKSPSNDNLDNFPNYIKTQAESVKKYIKESSVKKDIFLVVPTNTIDKIDVLFYDMGDYSVYVITQDSLEPIILSLRKIEDYEFAEKLSPEDRDQICRVIGKFAHSTKRRLQIDSFFADESISLLKYCENLPEEVLKDSVKYELGTKLNPPIEKRAKKIELKKLKTVNSKIKKELEIHNVNTKVDSEQIEKIKLYKKKVIFE